MAAKTATQQRLDDISDKIDDGFKRLEDALLRHANDDKGEFAAHNKRISSLEVSHAGLLGKLAVVSVLASAAVAAAAKWAFGS